MQQLIITMMAVFGMIVPVMTRKFERILATPRVLKLSRHLLVTLAQADYLAPQLVDSAARIAARPAPANLQTRAAGHHLRFFKAVFWRDRDVDMPTASRCRQFLNK